MLRRTAFASLRTSSLPGSAFRRHSNTYLTAKANRSPFLNHRTICSLWGIPIPHVHRGPGVLLGPIPRFYTTLDVFLESVVCGRLFGPFPTPTPPATRATPVAVMCLGVSSLEGGSTELFAGLKKGPPQYSIAGVPMRTAAAPCQTSSATCLHKSGQF